MIATHWWPAYVGVGSNLDGPEEQVDRAIDAMRRLPNSILVSESGRYRSAPLGPEDQPDFVNAVVGLLTQLEPRDLFGQLREIETRRGRKRGGESWGPRRIDLDLLAYAGLVIDDKDLTVPHPGIGGRNFVLLPWREIAPNYRVPGLREVAVLAAEKTLAEPHITRIGK